MDTALMMSKLKAADPTIVDGPSSPGQRPKFMEVSRTASKISGALDPKAMRVKFATVGFQTVTLLDCTTSPCSSFTLMTYVVDVILSIPLQHRKRNKLLIKMDYLRHKNIGHNTNSQEQIHQGKGVEHG
jgi:hypothetical protein